MEQVAKALLHVEWAEVIDGKPRTEDIPLQYNPTELSWDKGVQIADALPKGPPPLDQQHLGLYHADDALRDLILNRENVS